MSDHHPRGVFCAALTPLNDDLTPDHATFVAHCRHLIEEGCDGIAMLGTTGEANSFSVDERKALLDAAVEGGISPERLLPGTGVAALTDTVALTKHALGHGVGAVVMLPPFYYKAISDDGLYASYAEVVERIGDPRLKIVLYHIPQMSAVPIPHAVIERLRRRYPSVFVAIKDSSGDRAHMEALLERFPELSLLVGADPLMLPLLGKGAAGCITATSNIVAADLAFVFRNHADPTRAEEIAAAQERIIQARSKASQFPQMAALKALLARRSGHEGWRRLRPPLLPLSKDQLLALEVSFSSFG